MLLSETVEHRRRFAPGWPLWVFTLSLLPLLLGLGTWQLQRAEQKQQLQADIDALAAPLFDPAGQMVGSVTALGRAGKFDASETGAVAQSLRAFSQKVST